MDVKSTIYTTYRDNISNSDYIEILVIKPLNEVYDKNRDMKFELNFGGHYIGRYSNEEIEAIVSFLKEVLRRA